MRVEYARDALRLHVQDFLLKPVNEELLYESVRKQIETLELYTYNKGLKLLDYSYATAVGMFQSVVSIVLLFLANGLSKAVRGETII